MDIMLRFNKALVSLTFILFMSVAALSANDNLPKVNVNGKEFYYYEIKKGDSLYGLKKRFGWDEEKLRAANSNLDAGLKKGAKLYYPVTVEEQVVQSEPEFETTPDSSTFFYNVKAGDTLYAIAKQYHATVASIVSLNPGLDENQIKTGSVLRISPNNSEVQLAAEPVVISPEDVVEVSTPLADRKNKKLEVVVLLPDPNSKKDIEFLRGFLLGVEAMGKPYRPMNVRVIECGADASGVLADPGVKNADLLIATFEKNFPEELVELSTENKIPLINVFDLKTKLYENNPEFVQVLPPTQYFNAAVEKYISQNLADRVFLFVGNERDTEADSLNSSIIQAVAQADATFMTIADLAALKKFSLETGVKYVIVPDVTKKADVEAIAEYIISLKNSRPQLDMALFGKPNWIVYTDVLKDKFAAADIYIPSRFYFDSTRLAEEDFSMRFNQAYDQKPVKSFPMYALMGSDIAACIIPSIMVGNSNLSNGMLLTQPVQMQFDFKREAGGGLVNTASEIIHITPDKIVDIIEVK